MPSISSSLLVTPDFSQPAYIHITPASAQWEHLGFAARRMTRGETWDFETQENELALAIASIARLARHQGMQVRFVPGPDAVTAQIAVPGSVVSHPAPTIGTSLPESADAAFVPHESERRVAVPAHSWLEESEAFLERVFAPLRLAQATASASGEGVVLRVRVPGERFVDMGDDSPSTVAAEAAVEIRSALTTFDQGRRSAEITG